MWPFDRLAAAFRRAPAQDAVFSEEFWRSDLGVGLPSASGAHVNWRTTLEVTTAFRAGMTIVDGVATVPCKVMRKDPDTGRRTVATDHPLHELLDFEPNDWMDPLEFFETVAMHVVFTGNAFVFVNRVRGRIRELIPLQVESVRIERKDDYSLVYHVTDTAGGVTEYPQSAIWHMRGPSWNSYSGLDVTRLAREALGLAMATQDAHARRFANGIQSTGMYSVDGNLDKSQHQRIRAYLEQRHVGLKNSGKPLILDRNAKWHPLDLSGVDAQHLETRKHQIQEICAAFGVLPIMVGHYDKAATYASAEQMFLHHNQKTVRPWHRRFERSMKRSLLTPEDARAGYYLKFFDAELLRGAAKDRAEYYWKRFQMGMSPNKIAELEDEDGFDGGDIHLVPSNMMTAENAATAGPGGAPSNMNPADADEDTSIGGVRDDDDEEDA